VARVTYNGVDMGEATVEIPGGVGKETGLQLQALFETVTFELSGLVLAEFAAAPLDPNTLKPRDILHGLHSVEEAP
jgi:hypothetical protein